MINYFKKNKIAIFSDLHLGVHQNSGDWYKISKDWAEWIVAELKKKKIKDIVFCGDYFHDRSEINVHTINIANHILELFHDFNITMIVGNHDSYRKEDSEINSLKPYNKWSNVTVVDGLLVTTSHDKTFCFAPWGTDINSVPNNDVLFGHFEINSFRMNTFRVCDNGISSNDFLSKSKLIISGHFHLRDERIYDNGKIIYVGNPFQMDFGDAGTQKGYYILDIDQLTYEFFENELSPKHYAIKTSEIDKDKNYSFITDNFVKIKVDNEYSQETLEEYVKFIVSYKPKSYKVDYISFDQKSGDDSNDLSGIDISEALIEFINGMNIENKESVTEYVLNLYNKNK